MILTMVAMLSLTTSFAAKAKMDKVNDMKVYEWNVNMHKLSDALSLSAEQEDVVTEIHRRFARDLWAAARTRKNDRKERVEKALDKNVMRMRSILDNKQMRTYLTILNVTVNNRGLNM